MTRSLGAHHEKFVGSLFSFAAFSFAAFSLAAFSLATLLVASFASAQAEAPSDVPSDTSALVVSTPEIASTHLRWSGPEGCPSEEEVRVLALERMRALPEGAPLLLLEVAADVGTGSLGFEATLRAGDVERRFASPSCLTIARSVALVFSEWVVEGPVEAPPEEPPAAVEATEITATESATEATDATATTTDAIIETPVVAPAGRGTLRFVGGFLLGYDAFAMPVVEPTAFLSLGVGIDAFEVDVSPMGLGLTNFGLGAAEDARMILYGGRLRVGVMFELSPEWELGGHLLTEVALINVSRDNGAETSRAIFATFGAGLDLRFFPLPFLGVGFSVQVPFPLTKSTLSLPSVGLTYEQDWATLVMGLGVVVRLF